MFWRWKKLCCKTKINGEICSNDLAALVALAACDEVIWQRLGSREYTLHNHHHHHHHMRTVHYPAHRPLYVYLFVAGAMDTRGIEKLDRNGNERDGGSFGDGDEVAQWTLNSHPPRPNRCHTVLPHSRSDIEAKDVLPTQNGVVIMLYALHRTAIRIFVHFHKCCCWWSFPVSAHSHAKG